MKPPPSLPNTPIVSCRMTDRDIIERVSFAFDRRVLAIDRGRYRTEYGTTIKGQPAAELMRTLRDSGSPRCRRDDLVLVAVLRRQQRHDQENHPPTAPSSQARALDGAFRSYRVDLRRGHALEPFRALLAGRMAGGRRKLPCTASIAVGLSSDSGPVHRPKRHGGSWAPPTCKASVHPLFARQAAGMVSNLASFQTGSTGDLADERTPSGDGQTSTGADSLSADLCEEWRRPVSNRRPRSRTFGVYRHSRRFSLVLGIPQPAGDFLGPVPFGSRSGRDDPTR
ncbi:hypothetical protein BH20ACT15_BH20ACT15_09760 [soil metagenome]